MTDAIQTRRNAAIILEHAIARLGYYDTTCTLDDLQAIWRIQQSKWGLEAMDSPATSRFWAEQRLEYDTMLASL